MTGGRRFARDHTRDRIGAMVEHDTVAEPKDRAEAGPYFWRAIQKAARRIVAFFDKSPVYKLIGIVVAIIGVPGAVIGSWQRR
jgi:hypothetical protein